ncbi:MAG: hypothetical protein KME08_20175 [Aphanothece sp. CMT-3BRIN-NPC111]|nr:hypothetical protein [Aphanothece sp. CMT-3BRIN-NPC111]
MKSQHESEWIRLFASRPNLYFNCYNYELQIFNVRSRSDIPNIFSGFDKAVSC